MTHNQTFPGPSGLPVNLRMRKDLLPPDPLQLVLNRVLHYIVSTRSKHPNKNICICKVDLDSAFCLGTQVSSTATDCLTSPHGTENDVRRGSLPLLLGYYIREFSRHRKLTHPQSPLGSSGPP
jgi:hypothetical protein